MKKMEYNIEVFIESMAQFLDESLKKRSPVPMGFFLSIFEIGKGSENKYASNVEREGMIRALREIADTLEKQKLSEIKPIGNA